MQDKSTPVKTSAELFIELQAANDALKRVKDNAEFLKRAVKDNDNRVRKATIEFARMHNAYINAIYTETLDLLTPTSLDPVESKSQAKVSGMNYGYDVMMRQVGRLNEL